VGRNGRERWERNGKNREKIKNAGKTSGNRKGY
jgi:hypothetical protein